MALVSDELKNEEQRKGNTADTGYKVRKGEQFQPSQQLQRFQRNFHIEN